MTKKEIEKISELISELDTAVGKLIVPATKNELVEDAMQQVSKVSFELSNMLS
ncbi:MAG: hypothetical protein WAP07_09820 [Acutalibacteraceae bacterium]|jgi:chaperonin cofactor prefoldin